MPEPLTVGALAVLLGAGLSRNRNMTRNPPPSDGKWTFPVPAWRSFAPTRSQEYRPADHHGVDIMYPRDGIGGPAQFVAGSPHGSRGFFMPDGILACAARDGLLWSAGRSPRGFCIVLDHGSESGFASFYQHLSSLASGIPGDVARGAGGILVKAGDPLGVIGFDPLDAEKLMHLHFEVWYQGGAEAHVDPWPLISHTLLPSPTST